MKRPAAPAAALPADRVDAWRVRRQLLARDTFAGSPEEVATELIGVQAQVTSSAALSIAIRSRAGSLLATTRAIAERRLVRAWAMRGTLHLFAADDFPTIIAGLRYRENWRTGAWLRYFEVTEAEVEAIIAAIGEILDDGHSRTRQELADALGARLGPKIGSHLGSSWGTFLKPAANRGFLIQAPSDGPNVAYVRPDRWLSAWRTVEPDAALAELATRYLHAYGPASVAELVRWWGGQRNCFKDAVRGLGDRIAEVEVGGRRALVLAADIAEIEAAAPIPDEVLLLGSFDPFTIGAGLREHLIPAAHLKRVSRTAGWISPVVLVGGRVGGVWTSAREGSGLHLTIEPFGRPSRALKAAIEAAAVRVAAIHQLELRITFGPVFPAPAPVAEE